MSDSQTDSTPAPSLDDVNDALNSVRARLRGHAGDIEVIDVAENGDVTVEFKGACRGCPAIGFTYGAVVEPHLAAVDGVRDVKAGQVRMAPAVRKRIKAMTKGRGPSEDSQDGAD